MAWWRRRRRLNAIQPHDLNGMHGPANDDRRHRQPDPPGWRNGHSLADNTGRRWTDPTVLLPNLPRLLTYNSEYRTSPANRRDLQ